MENLILYSMGKRIRDLRKSQGLTQEKLGEISGFQATYIGAVERAEKNISLLNIQKIAEALNQPVAELFSYEKFSNRTSTERETLLNEIYVQLSDMKTSELKKVRLLIKEIIKK